MTTSLDNDWLDELLREEAAESSLRLIRALFAVLSSSLLEFISPIDSITVSTDVRLQIAATNSLFVYSAT